MGNETFYWDGLRYSILIDKSIFKFTLLKVIGQLGDSKTALSKLCQHFDLHHPALFIDLLTTVWSCGKALEHICLQNDSCLTRSKMSNAIETDSHLSSADTQSRFKFVQQPVSRHNSQKYVTCTKISIQFTQVKLH